ncbi:MAG: hypothetical protein OXU45_09855 [Candidatus Melainabacteria bacterium]|nr:hypothetical protein [Candidatus Melainabacteria bacterium]
MDLADLAAITPDIAAASFEIADALRPKEEKEESPEAKTENLAQELSMPIVDEQSKTKPEEEQGFFHKIVTEPNHRNIFISTVNALLHFIATITSFENSKSDSLMKAVNKVSNDAAFLFTRWIAPITSYGYAFFEALKNKKPIEALIKLVPPSFLPLVGDANIDAVYGSSTGFNQPYDLVVETIKEKSERSPEFAAYAQKANQSYLGNIKLTWQVFKEMVSDFVQGKLDPKKGIFFVNCSMILPGALPIMLFARDARDTLTARALGLLRNVGGILGDIGFLWGERANVHKLTIGILCMIGACADIVKRWVSDDAAKVLIHLGSALNVSAYALWNAYNGQKNKEKKVQSIKAPVQAQNTPVLQVA